MSAAVQVVAVAAAAAVDGLPDHDSARLAAALGAAGVPLAGRVIVD